MALRVEETEFLNNIDKVLSKNFSHLKDQFNAIIDDKSTQALLDISQNLYETQNQLLYYQVFTFVTIIIAVWYCYQILTGRFIEHLHQSISNKILKSFEEDIVMQEKRFIKLEAMFKYQFDLVKDTQSLLDKQNLIASSTLRSVSEYEKKLFTLARENERLHAELTKTQNILSKKIKKIKEQNAGE